jgi:Protein of unknown function (DUF1571)
MMPTAARDSATSAANRRSPLVGATLACAIIVPVLAAISVGRNSADIQFYSTAAPPSDYPGPEPERTADSTPVTTTRPTVESAPTRLISATRETPPPLSEAPKAAVKVEPDTIAQAKAAIASSARTYAGLQDYTCIFFKRERIDGKLTPFNSMQLKARTNPQSLYLKFVRPTAGREAIYVAGSFSGKVVVHDVGIGKLLAGTLKLDPRGSMAMEDNRHPITDAGIGKLIETVVEAWDRELSPAHSHLVIHPHAKVGPRACVMIESTHAVKKPGFLYHMVKVYIDKEHNLPIRFEAYDWPRNGKSPELVEEYTYSDLKLNVGLTTRDFDPNNPKYSFGRF